MGIPNFSIVKITHKLFGKIPRRTVIRPCRFLLPVPCALSSPDSGPLSPRYHLHCCPIKISSQLPFQYLSTSAQKHGGVTYVLCSLLRTKAIPLASRRLNFPELHSYSGTILILLSDSSPLLFTTLSALTPSHPTLP